MAGLIPGHLLLRALLHRQIPVHLSRLRERSTRSESAAGGGLFAIIDRLASGTPSPALPRKRERERTADAEALPS